MLLKGNYAFEVKRCAIALLCRTLMAQSIEFKKDSEIELHGVDEKLDSSLKQEKNKKRYISKTYELWKSMTKAIPATTDPKEDERFDKHFGKKASSDTKIHKFTNLLIEKQMKELHILEMGVENASYFCDAANEVEETEEWNEGYVFDEAKQLTYKDAIGDVLRWVFSELSKWMGKLYRILYAACTSFHKFDNPQSTFQIIESLPSEMIICVSIASMFDPRSNLFKEMLKDFATVGLFLSWMPDYKSFYSTRNNSLGNEGRNKLRISEKCFIREEQDRSESKRWMANVTLELLKFKKSKEEEEEEEEKKIIDACWIVVSAMKRAAGEPTRLPDLCLSTKELVDTKKFEEISGFKEKDYERDRKDNTMKTTHLTKDKNYETRSTLKEEFRKRTEFMNEVEQHLELPTSIFERLTTEARVFGSNDGVDLWKRLLDEEINSKESKEKKKAFTTREEDRKMRPQLKIETESTKDMMSSLFGKRKALMVLNSEEKKNSALFGKMEKDKEKKEEKWMCSDEGCRMNCPSLPSKWVLRQFEGTVMKDDLKKQNFQKETEMDDSNRKEKINDISSHEFEDKKLQLIYDKSHDTIVSSTEKFKLAIARHIELARNQTLQPALEIPKIPEISSMNSKTNQLSSIQNFHKDGGFVGSMKTEIKIEGSTNECVNGSCIFKQYEPELMVEKSSSLKEKATLFDGLDCEKKLGSTFFLEGEKKAHEEERTMATKSSSNEAQFPVLNSKELQSFTFKPFVPPTLTMQTPQSTQKALTVNSEKVSSNSFMPVSFGSKGVKSGAFRGMSKEPRSTRGGIVAPKIQFRELTAEELKKS
ncbi:uncharacterized protein MONOS_12179 [Monocercomonoides exilis]|uniref:uncharacterized protein n=1 Tax=Monocercomonoides exilis TaxID=2049356 RepID=UPI003559860E|nr:hypothetical protein MONOS_12179 [Monocercomonoides exilis]|eukprot:MONOS_12179.1-p1 / transcript=MONOS_12179.1 / gene=MONOS_12179 / organism=Monocercomonoides_exilis_PA203 / gene_product=unspecified product / transcript_product=unspecified product / location=Mono_scaffold00656:25426-27885(-) / protein_length=820 / sequence_SO=supercontig / SO=protein_coding / is_pseudo=false